MRCCSSQDSREVKDLVPRRGGGILKTQEAAGPPDRAVCHSPATGRDPWGEVII